MHGLIKTISHYKDVVLLGFIAIPVGIAVGAAEALFGRGLEEITGIREKFTFQLTPFLPLAGMLIAYTYFRIGKNCAKGMSILFSAAFNEKENIPMRLVPLLMGSTWITHLFGGSAGREGAAVQIGGTMAYSVGKHLNTSNASRIMLIAGMAAGFSGMFQTPLAAIFFAMEVLTAGVVEYGALFPCITASFAACYTSHALGLEKFTANLPDSPGLSTYFILKTALSGILFGITGGLFAYALNLSRKYFGERIRNPVLRIFIAGCILSVLLLVLHSGRYSGSGENLIAASFSGEKLYIYDWIFKFLLTILTMSAGFQGGEVTPLFSIGATLGAVISPVLGLPAEFASALGFIAVFGAATNTILAPVFVGAEVFGYDYLPYFFIVSAVAYVFNGNKSIYSCQRIWNGLVNGHTAEQT